MIGITAVSSVQSMNHGSIMTNKIHESREADDKTALEVRSLSVHDVRTDSGKQVIEGVLTKFRKGVRDFTFGVLKPANGVVGEKIYETSASETAKNLRKKYSGALTGFNNRIHGFAFGILRPGSGIVGEKIYHSSHSNTLKNLKKEHLGAAASIKNTLREYAKSAIESAGPPVSLVDPITLLQNELPNASAVDDTQRVQHVNLQA